MPADRSGQTGTAASSGRRASAPRNDSALPAGQFTPADRRHMARALRLAARGQGRVSPNPMVGALVVRDGAVVGEGWHRRFGGPHAEVESLAAAGNAARGATLYVTLEPCAHHGKTPPCTEAIRAAGVTRVVAAMRDPNPRVIGGGAAWLRRRGIAVSEGLLEPLALELIRGFVSVARRGRPWVTVKLAASLDGGIATAGGRSQWITGPPARKEAHRLRAGHDAVVVGAATVMADDPALTVRHVRGADPARIVLDPKLKGSTRARWLADDGVRRIVAASAVAPASRRRAFEAAGAEVWTIPVDSRGGLQLLPFLRRAAREGFLSLLVEGGGRLAGVFLGKRLADRLVLFTAPILLGGDSRRWTSGGGALSPALAPRLVNVRHRRLGDDWVVSGDLPGGHHAGDRAYGPRGEAKVPGQGAGRSR